MTLNELNDYAGQHEVIAENLTSQIITELGRYTQELKTERKSVSYRAQTPPLILLSPPSDDPCICVLDEPAASDGQMCREKERLVFGVPLPTIFCANEVIAA